MPIAALAVGSMTLPYLERLNGEIKRRTNVVGIFPNTASIARLIRLYAMKRGA